MAAVVRRAAPLALALLVAGCASSPEAPPPAGEAAPSAGEAAPSAVTPPAGPERSTLLVAPTTAGSTELGSFLVAPGNLWIGGQCSGGDLEVHVDPVVVLPIPCQALAGGPFLNRIVIRRPTAVTISVTAPEVVTWELQVEQS